MATKLAEGYMEVRAKLDRFKQDMADARNTFSAKMKDMATIAGGVGLERAFAGIARHVRDSVSALVATPAQFDQFQASLSVMLKSERKAAALIEDIKKMAAATPFEIPGLIQSAQQLKMYGFQAEQLLPMLDAIGNAAAASPKGMAFGLERISRAIGQIKAAGTVKAGDMRQLTEVGVPAWDLLAKGLGVSVGEAMSMAQKRLISAEKGIDIILKGINDRFGGMMDKQNKTFLGQTSNFADNMTRMRERVGRPLTQLATKALTTFNKAFETKAAQQMMNAMRDRMQRLAATIESVAKRVVAFVSANREWIATNARLAVEFAKVSGAILGMGYAVSQVAKLVSIAFSANPIFLVAAAVGLAAVAYMKWKKEIDGFIASNALIQRMILYVRGIADVVGGVLVRAWGFAKSAAGGFWGWLTARVSEHSDAFHSMAQSIIDVWLDITDFLKVAMAKVGALFMAVFQTDFMTFINGAIAGVVNFGTQVLDQVSLFTTALGEVDNLTELWTAFSDGLVMIFSGAMKDIIDMWESATKKISDWILENAAEGGLLGTLALAGTGIDAQNEAVKGGDEKQIAIAEKHLNKLRKQKEGLSALSAPEDAAYLDKEIAKYEKLIGMGKRAVEYRKKGIGGPGFVEGAQDTAHEILSGQANTARDAIGRYSAEAKKRQEELRKRRSEKQDNRAKESQDQADEARRQRIIDKVKGWGSWLGDKANPKALGGLLGNASNVAAGAAITAKDKAREWLAGLGKNADAAKDKDQESNKTKFVALDALNKQIQESITGKKDPVKQLVAIAQADQNKKDAFRVKVEKACDKLNGPAKADA